MLQYGRIAAPNRISGYAVVAIIRLMRVRDTDDSKENVLTSLGMGV